METDQLKPATAEGEMEVIPMNMGHNKKLQNFYWPNYHNTISSDPSHNDEFTSTITNTTSAVPMHFLETPPNNTISFSGCGGGGELRDDHTHKRNSMVEMREMIFRMAAMQPIHIEPESVKPPKRRNVKISKDPQSVAARHRRERISERIRILQRLVPGGTKMDTASMLDEAIHYVKFLKNQVQSLEKDYVPNNNNKTVTSSNTTTTEGTRFPVVMSNGSYVNPIGSNKPFHHQPPSPPPLDYSHQCLQH